MFNLYGNDRLIEWKKFRDSLENSASPFSDVANLWARAPFINPYLNPDDPKNWPDPWHLILDDRYDDLAITLGIMYTLQLTRRFMNNEFEIHMSMHPQTLNSQYLLSIKPFTVFDISSRKALNYDQSLINSAKLIWQTNNKNKYHSI